MSKDKYEQRIQELERQVEGLLKCLTSSNEAIKMTATAAMGAIRRNPGREQLEGAIKKVS